MLVSFENQNLNLTTWILDSSASFHVPGESQNIQQLESFENPNQIYIGNGQGLSVQSSCFTKICSPLNSSFPLALNKLLHVPSVTKNLISVSKFCKHNHVFFEFHPNHCVVKSHATNEVLLHGSLGPDILYVCLELQTF